MRKSQLFYRMIAFLLAFLMTVSSESVVTMAETVSDNNVDVEETVLPEEGDDYDTDIDYKIESTDSFGEMFASLLEEKSGEQEENNGYNIFSIEMDGTNAQVDFETQEDCTLVVGVYDESGKKLLASGYAGVKKGEESATVEISSGTVPAYFYLRAYLVQNGTLRPLCSVFESNLYSQGMQELLQSTIADYDADRILNLDASEDNNFAVYSQNTKVLKEADTAIRLMFQDKENEKYIFSDPDGDMLTLDEGDVFSFEQSDGEVLIVEIKTIDIDETTVTINGISTEVGQAFDYVKMDNNIGSEAAVLDTSEMPEGVVYEGDVDENTENIIYEICDTVGGDGLTVENNIVAGTIGGNASVKKKFTIKEKKLEKEGEYTEGEVSVNGSVVLGVDVGAKLLVSIKEKEIYVELKMDYSAGIELEISGSAKGKIPLAPAWDVQVCEGTYVHLSPTIVLEVSGKVKVSGELKGTIGIRYSLKNGLKDLSKSPKFTTTVKAEIKVFIGISLEPKAKILSGCEMSLTTETGVELKFVLEKPESHHECKNCIKGEVYGRATLKAKLKIPKMLFFDGSSLEYKFEVKTDATDCYYSVDFDEFGWNKTCPHYKYEVDFQVTDSMGNSLNDVQILIDGVKYFTGNNGHTYGIKLPKGTYTATIYKSFYNKKTIKVTVKGKDVKKKIMLVNVSGTTSDGNDSLIKDYIAVENDNNTNCFVQGKVSIGGEGDVCTAAVLEDGSLYTWGHNGWGQLGDGTTNNNYIPTKIMENVKMVSLSMYGSAVVTNDGSLYIWGSKPDPDSELQDVTIIDSLKPKKAMSGIESVSLGLAHNAAISTAGNLYMWGENYSGQLGDGTLTYCNEPKIIMGNVKAVSLGDAHSAVITSNGDLYMWGSNQCGQIGDGTTTDRTTPEKIMSNVVTICMESQNSAAITTNGDLYVWGNNRWGQIGDGTTTDKYVPVKIMSNVASVCVGIYNTAAITTDGSLYMWGGNNRFGQIGDGTTIDRYTPIKIMDNVIDVALLWSNSAAITKDGSVYTWGRNFNGELGDGTTENRYTPTKVNILASDTKFINNFTAKSYDYISDLKANDADENTDTVDLSSDIKSAAGSTESDHANIFSGKGSFTGLLPNETYNYYVMKSVTKDDLFAEDNLLYIDQGISDESGNLNFDYEIKEDYAFPYAFAVGMTAPDISDAGVKVDNLIYDGTEQYPNPIVTWKGTTLKEGRDYYLSDDVTAKEVGSYTITVEGTGMYTGSVSSVYQVVKGNNGSGNSSTDASNKLAVVKVSSLSITGISKKIAAGKSVQLTAEISPANATNKAVTWTSGNTKYATVSAGGKVSVKKAGAGKTVTITAKANDGSGVTAAYKITIMKDTVKSVKLSAANKTVKAGKSIKLKATVNTSGKKVNKTLKWTSSNTDYATVNKNGKVTTKKAGKGKTVTITAQATDGSGKKAKIKIKIK